MADVGLAMHRALDKTEMMMARASVVEELQAAGTFEDLTAVGPGQDEIDPRLEQLGARTAVDDEFAQLKAGFEPGREPIVISATGETGKSTEAAIEEPAGG
jgi:phage shock protein A